MRIARLAGAALAAAVIAVLPGAPAWAHNSLTSASPDKNAELTESPTEIKLRFLQKLDERYVTIALTGPDGTKIEAGAPEVDDTYGTLTVSDPLPNGAYTVAYRVVSQDGHPVQGSYKFTVDDPSAAASSPPPAASAAPAPAASATASAEAVAAESAASQTPADSTSWWPIIAGAVVVALLAAGAVVFARRRKTT